MPPVSGPGSWVLPEWLTGAKDHES
jgi:hypothetical protein